MQRPFPLALQTRSTILDKPIGITKDFPWSTDMLCISYGHKHEMKVQVAHTGSFWPYSVVSWNQGDNVHHNNVEIMSELGLLECDLADES
ncbi:hypothetical protein J6590_071996 [Homalodisca vitripennis]|nr:hypothetical protein J6590_071996 [Homalodisca vitripennis]